LYARGRWVTPRDGRIRGGVATKGETGRDARQIRGETEDLINFAESIP